MNTMMLLTIVASADAGSEAAAGLIGGLFLLFGFVLCLMLWLLPGIIANARKHHNQGAIWALTLLLGWTFIGWVVAIVWSFTNPPAQQQITINNDRQLTKN